jgi:hypothetical protein
MPDEPPEAGVRIFGPIATMSPILAIVVSSMATLVAHAVGMSHGIGLLRGALGAGEVADRCEAAGSLRARSRISATTADAINPTPERAVRPASTGKNMGQARASAASFIHTAAAMMARLNRIDELTAG